MVNRYRGSNPEAERMLSTKTGQQDWDLWGPYLSERQWGTVREDYSENGTAWDYFPFEHARSRAYRWGEDGIAGLSDKHQQLCIGIALWNGQDEILKERLFGLSNIEGNHGEDVKEIYYYLDALPSHAYLKYLYKYPHAAFPYAELVESNKAIDRRQREYELLDTGVFKEDRYFDVFIEYAKAGPEDILMRIRVHNRGPEPAKLHVLPQLWFRNTWAWKENVERPSLRAMDQGEVMVSHPSMDQMYCYVTVDAELLFCDNDTNVRRLYGADAKGYFKDAFHDYLISGNRQAINPELSGTKMAVHHPCEIAAGEMRECRLRLAATRFDAPFDDFEEIIDQRIHEADIFYESLQATVDDGEQRLVQRQALAGMIWGKQFYYLDIPEWLNGDPATLAPPESRKHGRNSGWDHLNNADVLSMPDKWEYPWYAAWDLAFQCLPLALVAPEFAKNQLILLTREWYMHPNGQLPAYEWDFSDVNPPVHAWAAWEVYCLDRDANRGQGDIAFLERIFHKLVLNFTWWVNRKDADGRNIFQGGFLGLDNIGVFDRSSPLPTGGHINQADGTAWMAMYSLNLMRISLELAMRNHVYEDMATKFFEHFLHIASAMNNIGDVGIEMWDEETSFYYDVLNLPDGVKMPLKICSLVGLLPLCAVEVLEPELLDALPDFKRRLKWFLNYRPELYALVSHWDEPGRGQRSLISLLRGHRMKMLIKRLLDETEFLSDFGVRSLSRMHAEHPYTFHCKSDTIKIEYWPAESRSYLFGGNSNWRGPIWLPINYILINALRRFHGYYMDDFRIECPTGSGNMLSLGGVADELSGRLVRLFTSMPDGRRAVFGDSDKHQADPHFKDYVLFYEYFHGDDGRGLGASHQTGWTGLVANLIQTLNLRK
jgi:Mannosylglycerate hydrolase MGH1-like glycoside hydrolase domain